MRGSRLAARVALSQPGARSEKGHWPRGHSERRHLYALCRDGAARHLSMSKLTVPVVRGNLFEWLKQLKVVIERLHLDRGELAETGVISIFEVYHSVLHADHRGDRPSLCLP